MGYGRPLIGEILAQKFELAPSRLAQALALQQEKGGRIGDLLIKLNALRDDEVGQGLSAQLSLPWSPHLDPSLVDRTLVERVPLAFARRYQVLPLRRDGGQVVVATVDPLQLTALDDIRLLLGGAEVKPILTTEKALIACLHQVYDQLSRDKTESAMEDLSSGENLDQLASELEEPLDLLDAVDEAPLIRLVNSVMFQAVKQRASDIHVEPLERGLVIRYRIDGVLYPVLTPPRHLLNSIVARIKIMAGLNIAEKRLPQDGRFNIRTAGKEVDIRVSVLPTAYGERAVLRLLEKEAKLLSLSEIGLDPDAVAVMQQLIHLSHGIILATGPTGSGKTTTLYAALSQINAPDKNIITIEDPVEYQLRGVGQVQVNPKINLTFAAGLRSILRQDPDVIMIGEIRDLETAEIAIHASLTGHLVFSTLHTNDAAGAVTRLIDMGIEPFLVGSSVIAIVAQRLVRLTCRACRLPYRPPREELAQLGLADRSNPPMFYRGQGCEACARTGYCGRTGIYELLLVDDEIRRHILAKADSSTIKAAAVARKMRTLKEAGAEKVWDGLTTTEEVMRVSQHEVEV